MPAGSPGACWFYRVVAQIKSTSVILSLTRLASLVIGPSFLLLFFRVRLFNNTAGKHVICNVYSDRPGKKIDRYSFNTG